MGAASIDIGDLIAGLALAVSIYAAYKTFKFNERQKSLIESQERLNSLLEAKEKNEFEMDKKADLGASFIKLYNNSHRLKIYNKGKATARNISIEFPEGNEIFIKSEIEEIFPLEFLESYQAVELIAAISIGTKRKYAVKLIWSDDFNKSNEKIVYPTL